MEIARKYLEIILSRLFLTENSLDPKLQLLSQLMESVVYVIIINGIRFSQVFGSLAQSPTVFIGMILLCFLKLTMKHILRFGANFIVLQIIILKVDPWLIPNCLLLTVVTASQFLGSIAFNYSSSSMQAETRIYNKAFRVFLLMGNIVLVSLVKTTTYVHLVSAVLFLLLLWSKERSLMKSEQYRAIALRFYLYAGCQHIRLFLTTFLPFTSNIFAAVISFLLSQSLFSLLVYFRPPQNCHQLLAKEEHLRLAFILLRYTHSNAYDQKLQEFISSFVKETAETEIFNRFHFKKNPLDSQSQALQSNVLGLLDKSDGFLQSLLRAEVHTERGRLFLGMKQLVKARNRLSRYDLLRRVMLIHAKKRLIVQFCQSSSKVNIEHEEAWKSFLQFQQLLHKAAFQHLRFNLYLKRTDIQLAKIKQLCFKLISIDKEVQNIFQEVKRTYKTSTQLFVGFQVLVLGDYSKAQQIFSLQRLNEWQMFDGCLQEKLFISLRITTEGLIIERVGFNAHELLGFSREQLQGQPVERLVPSFFRTQHQKISATFVHGNIDHGLLFQKQTIILNSLGKYNFCSMLLRLGMNEGEFCYQGQISVTKSDRYDLDSFFVANQTGGILQHSEGIITEQFGQKTNAKMHQLFQGTFGACLVRTTQEKLYQIYEPIIFFGGETPCYFYAKIKGKKKEEQEEGTSKDNYKQQIPLNLKQRAQSVKESAENISEIETDIKSKEIIALFVLIAILMGGLFFSEYLIILSANIKYNSQYFAVRNSINVMQYYNTSCQLYLNLLYLDFKQIYNYSNNFLQLDLGGTALKLQSVNQQLKQFNLGKYTLPTLNPAIQFSESNYQLVLMLIANSFSYQHFKNDSYMRSAVLDQFKQVATVQATQSIVDYRNSLISFMGSLVQNDIYYQNLAFWLSFSNIIIFVFFGIRIYWKLTQIQNKALRIRCTGSFHTNKINDIIRFLKGITLEPVPIDQITKEMQVYEVPNRIQNNSTLISEASLVRQSQVRNISHQGNIPFYTGNKDGFVENMEKFENHHKAGTYGNYTLRNSDSYKCFLIVFGLFIGSLVTINIINQVTNHKNKNFDEVSSVTNVLALYKSVSIYSSKCIVITFAAMLLKNQKSIDTSSSYLSSIKSCQNTMSTYALPIFPEMQFSEFNAFSTGLSKLSQQPLCSLVSCDPQFSDQLNINFINVIKTQSLNLSPMYKTTFNFSQAQMADYLTNTNKHSIDLLFYTQMILRGYITALMMDYLNGYNAFMANVFNSKLNYATAMIAITTLGLIAFLLFALHIRREQKRFVMMIKLYRNDE